MKNTNTNEVWKDVKGYEGYYQISNKGRIKSLDRVSKNRNFKGKIMKSWINDKGYCHIDLNKGGERRVRKIHRLVAIAFIPNEENKEVVNHIDGNPLNNDVTNLEWCTHKENANHAHREGLVKKKREAFKNLTEEDIKFIKENTVIGNKHFGLRDMARRFNIGHHSLLKIIGLR